MKRNGFTIVELLMVIGIIGVLTGIVTTAASGAVKNSRGQRTKALCAIVQQGIAAYHAQRGQWPGFDPSSAIGRPNKEGNDRSHVDGIVVLRGAEVRKVIAELCQETKRGTPVMDVSGLFVSRQEGKFGQNCYGLDFMSAIHGTRQTSKKMKLSEMHFGYPDKESGNFRHFKIVYSSASDAMSVLQMDSDREKATFYE